MALGVEMVNQYLDLALKLVLLGLLLMVVVLVRDIDRAVRSGEKTLEALKGSAQAVAGALALRPLLNRFRKGDKDE